MNRLALAAVAATFAMASPAFAALKPGDKAPEFKAPAYLAGKPFTYELKKALKKGPVVVYFFPSAYTAGCNLEAHLFSEAIPQFQAQKATVIGVTAGRVADLARFSAETEHCGGKFPVAADATLAIARQYDSLLLDKDGKQIMRDGKPLAWSNRTSYVIAPDGKVLLAYTDPKANDHVTQTLGAVTAYRAKHK